MKILSLLCIAAFAGSATLNAALPAAAAPKNITTELKNDLVALSGKTVKRYDDTKLADKKYIAVYYSAHWCPPCRAFTPKLVEWYNANKGANPHFELIFVSSDHTEKDMHAYMAGEKMPWPALSFAKKKTDKALAPHAGPGIPCLVLLDSTGKVLSHSYESGKYVGPTKVMKDIEDTLKANPATGAAAAPAKP